MWKYKLRKKKVQFLLVGIILFFASAIFSTCLCFTTETNRYAADYFSKQNCPDYFVCIGSGAPLNSLTKEAEDNPDIQRTVTLEGRHTDSKILLDGRDITPGYYSFYALPDYHSLSWNVTPVKGNQTESGPADGEIWVNGIFADQNGVKTGDRLSVDGSEFTVSAIINDSTCPSTMFGIYPFYVSGSALESSIGGIPCRFFAFSTRSAYTDAEIWLHGLPSSINNAVIDSFNIAQIKLSFSMFTLVLGSIGLLSAVMIFVVSIIIIRFLIKNNLMKEYRAIGIYKALGFTNRQIIRFYLKCYAFAGSIGLALGAASGLPLGYLVGAEIMRYLDGFHLTVLSFLCASGGAVLLFALLLFFVWRAHRRIRYITPVQALQIGVSSSPKKLKRSVLRSASSSLATAVNDICKHRSFSAMFVIILTVSFYLSLFFLSINYTCNHIDSHSDIWFGIPKSDCFVTGSLTDDNIDIVQQDPAVKDCIYGSPIVGYSIKMEENAYNASFDDSSIVCWNDYSSKFLNPCKTGRPPLYENEIAVSSGSIAGTKLGVGEYITLTIGNNTTSYLVTGIYDNMMHAGKSIEMNLQGLQNCGLSYQPAGVAVRLNSGTDYDAFAQRMQTHGLTVGKDLKSIQDSIKGVKEIINPVTILLVAVFVLFSLLNILNLLITTQIDSRRRFGILKSMGFSTFYISLQSLFKTLLLSLVSSALALTLHFTLSPGLFYLFLHVNALINDPLQLILLIGSIFAGILILTLFFCIPLRKISPVELMDE